MKEFLTYCWVMLNFAWGIFRDWALIFLIWGIEDNPVVSADDLSVFICSKSSEGFVQIHWRCHYSFLPSSEMCCTWDLFGFFSALCHFLRCLRLIPINFPQLESTIFLMEIPNQSTKFLKKFSSAFHQKFVSRTTKLIQNI